MAIIRNVNMDLNAVDPKFVGNFTIRQTIAVAIGGTLSVGVWALMPGNILIDVKIVLLMLINSPLIAFGWLDYNGLKIEDLIMTSLVTILLSPPVRKYKTINAYSKSFLNIKKKEKEKKQKRVKKRKHGGGKDV